MLSNRRWLLITITSALLVAALFCAWMMWVDVYGVYRNPAGRQIPIFYADREGKALLSRNYVPTNFDALLLGPSSSVNWHTEIIQQGFGFRMYNESLEGGDAAEEKFLTEQALRQGHFRFAMIVLYPTMISSHAFHDAVDKNSWTEGLGSINSIAQLVMASLKTHDIHFSKEEARPDGSHEMRHPGGIRLNADIDFKVDPAGLESLKTLTAELAQHGTRIVYVVPAVYQDTYLHHNAQFTVFRDTMMQQLAPGPLIDLDAPQYEAFRSDTANFLDDFHLSTAGSNQVSQILHDRLQEILRPAPPAAGP